MYHFISGYTAKVAGTEVGVTEPSATFSACFGAAFLALHPSRYAELMGEKIQRHQARVWLVNTGWSGGPYGIGSRFSLPHTRAIIDGIHDGSLDQAPAVRDSHFGFDMITECPGVPRELMAPEGTWPDRGAYRSKARELAGLFKANFKKYEHGGLQPAFGRRVRLRNGDFLVADATGAAVSNRRTPDETWGNGRLEIAPPTPS